MRYLIIGLAVLVATGVLCTVGGMIFENCLSEIENLLTLSEEAYTAGDYEGALAYGEAALACWHKHHDYFDATLLHDASARAEQLLFVTVHRLRLNRADTAPMYAETIEALRLMREGERFTIGNIL